MVALALSSSLLEQERESERALQMETAASHISSTPALKWRLDAGTLISVFVSTNEVFFVFVLIRHLHTAEDVHAHSLAQTQACYCLYATY